MHREPLRLALVLRQPVQALVVVAAAAVAALGADGHIFRRASDTTRAYRSPKTPASVALAVMPGIENKSRSD
jgi:hypothetical protein